MDLPGIKSKDIDIQLNDNYLTISGQRAEEKEEKEERGRTYHRAERHSGSFSRSVTLPCEVGEDKVTAEFKDGVLRSLCRGPRRQRLKRSRSKRKPRRKVKKEPPRLARRRRRLLLILDGCVNAHAYVRGICTNSNSSSQYATMTVVAKKP